ncbi:MAG TPA: hypothetical protein DD377_01840 [Firmicutes bacterium]|nr:hypothetical protein [Bacillota bacterium]
MWGNRGFFYRLCIMVIVFLIAGLPFLIPLSLDKNTASWLVYTIVGIYCGVFLICEVALEVYIYLKKKKREK